ncbi:beta strand repeat-containing protein [Maribacter sp. UBA6511]|uniref:beta strand repeat-containing protein n=1 Tax=Maribacter sp. UBA6511 TaxID=1946805 RepID=UPI0025806735|nr:Calx-beta domain-containing protein [Maribacter sp. UBA6511]|tara:strand:- start:7089 stop:11537 length:4449 start_codon:yes stop_codon:yes gene_type:complete
MRLKQFYYLILLLCSTSFFAQETYLDTFSNTSYSNNNGTQNFSSNWTEQNENSSAFGGRITITGGRLRFRNNDDRWIYRFVPLAGASTATLTLDYDANSANGQALDVYIYNADSNQWDYVQRINNGTGTITYNLTAAQIDSNPAIIFYPPNTNWGNNNIIYIDNVQFTATYGAELEINDVTVNEDDGTAIFTVRQIGSSTSAYSVNYTTNDISAISGQDYSVSSGTLNFNGSLNDTETITVPITDDTIFEGDETFGLSFTSTTNTDVDITDTAIGTILANDALIMTDGGSATTCDDTFLDSGGISNYSDNEDLVYTICPDTANNYTQVNFDQFDVIPGDILYVYDGNSTGATLIGQYDNDNIPTQIFATNTNGCLTFRFTSNNNTTGNGWQASVSCSPPGPKIVVEDVYVDEDSGSAIFTVTHVRDRHGYSWLFGFVETPFTVEYIVSDGTANNGSDYISVNGTLTFTGEVGNVQTFSVPIVDDGVPELVEYFTVGFSDATAQYASVDYSDTANGYINSQILANDPLTLFQEFDGYFDYSTTGGSLRTNDNNTDACSITTSSSNTLISPIPNTGTIKKAYLYWAHSSTVVDGTVTFEGQTVNANYQYQTTLTNRNFYGYVSDVTDIVEGVADPSTNVFDFSGLSVDNSNTYCSSATVLGGWTLFVFYEDPNLPAVNINLYQGFDGLSNDGNSFTLDSFYAIAGAGAKASFLSWEGDSTLDGNSSGTTNPNGERLSITNQANQDFTLAGDGGQTGNNAYNSTMYDNTTTPDYNVSTTYGVDLDTYDISTFVSPGDSQVTANVDVGQDFVISAAVVLKVPSNLIAGTVFEDVNYGGGQGRNMTNANGVGISSAIVELYESDGTFVRRTTSKVSGDYSFGGMADGDYYVKLVNSTVRSTRANGINCTTCVPVQTFRSYGDVNNNIEVLDEIGGADPTAFSDSALGVFEDSQSLSLVSIASSGVANIDFGYNFNTIVNTNEFGQGSLEQFILNSNTLGEVGLDIEANAIFDPAAEEDVSIFMIPPTGDSFGRTADVNYNAAGYFDILLDNANTFSVITGTNTIIDGRTQTAYSGDSNAGTVGSGGAGVGIANTALPNYTRPEIQIHRNGGDVLRLNGSNVTIRDISLYANNNAGVRVQGGSATISNNLLGVNALGASAGNIDYGIEQTGGDLSAISNYLSSNTIAGIFIDGGTRSTVQFNHLDSNGSTACDDNILIEDGSTIIIQENLIESAAASGIEIDNVDGVTVSNNNILLSGQNGGDCNGSYEGMAIKLSGDDSVIDQNRIYSNGSEGVVVLSGASNTISQNSIYANGTVVPSLGIDLGMDGVTLNDNSDSDSGPNNLENFPIINSAFISGSNLVVTGWASPGSTIEVFFTDVNEGTATLGDNQLGLTQDYGEGQTYIGTAVEGSGDDQDTTTSSYADPDGNTDNTNKYKFVFPLPSGTVVGDLITTTGTRSNSTSEFSPEIIISAYTVITNRNITYRIKGN